jgi:hypothetical protein
MAGVASDVRIGVLGPLEVRVGPGEPVMAIGGATVDHLTGQASS